MWIIDGEKLYAPARAGFASKSTYTEKVYLVDRNKNRIIFVLTDTF